LVLAIALTDATFERREVRGGKGGDSREWAWVGRCLHCNTKLVVAEEGSPASSVTIEHIVPQVHGGGAELANVALACDRCNHEKGRRHDHKDVRDPVRVALERTLLAKRADRLREPPAAFAHLLLDPYLTDHVAPAELPPQPRPSRKEPRRRGASRR
jgi:hypothetical protein